MRKKQGGESKLREIAESQLATNPSLNPPKLSAESLLHELQVHQLELEMQNEQLRQAQAELEASRDSYLSLYDFAPLGYITLSDSGLIAEINLTGAALLGDDRQKLLHRRFASYVVSKDKDAWHRQFIWSLRHSGMQSCELCLQRSDGTVFDVHLDCLPAADSSTASTLRIALSDITERRQLEIEREKLQQHLQELSHRLMEVQEDERHKLAMSLHDWIAPNLASLKIELHMIEKELPQDQFNDLKTRILDMQALIEDTDTSIHDLDANLRPSVLDYAGLDPAIESYCHQFTRRTGIHVLFTGTKSGTRLSSEVESALFRIALEALTNCAKYAEAKTATIELTHDALHAVMTIKDDGIGFDPQHLGEKGEEPGLGLLTMHERAEFVGGKMTLDSKLGRGTHITVEI